MFRLLILVFTPLLSLIVFTLGTGLLTTLLTVRLHATGGGSWVVGILTAVYYAGLVWGSFHIGKTIRRVGHIRVYAASASLLAVAIMLQGIFVNDWVWIALRFVCGFCTAGLYIAVESWLLVVCPEERRGQVLSLYMISFYAALASGQFLLNVSDPNTIIPFCLITILCAFSIFPITITRATSPNFENISPLSLYKLYKVSPSGVVGCFVGGIFTSIVYGVLPLLVSQLNYPTSFVALIMSVTIFGAMFIQYPIGRLSDYVERRKVLIVVSFATMLISIILIFISSRFMMLFVILSFIFGGVSFVIYPLSINLTCDYLGGRDMVAATQGLLLVNGIGSIAGPLMVPPVMHKFGPMGLFVYFAVVAGFLGVYFSWRRTKRPATPIDEQQEFVSSPRNSPVANELNPRADGK